jgi:hypothetical protein
VSYPAAVYRLSDLNFLNADEKTSMLEKSELAGRLLRGMDDFDGCDAEEDSQPGRKPDRELVSQIVRLAVEAYRREEVSQGWLRDLSDKLEMPAEELVELADAAASN